MFIESVRDYVLILLDPQGTVVSWNSGAEAIKGYRADEILGRHFPRLYPTDEVAANKPWQDLIASLREPDARSQFFCIVTQDLSQRK